MDLRHVGRFQIVGRLGHGAMGEVFRASDPVLKREVAIKLVAGKLSADAASHERFLKEAQAAAGLNHSNIITIYEFGEEQGQAWMAMELLEGQDLRELLAKGGVAGLDGKVAIMHQILDGLAFAHSKDVVHRDLKPGNVRVLPNGQIKIMDFGLARPVDAAATGALMGTPYYMSPEQIQGSRATKQSDIFSVGAMFYEMLTGRRPFTGPTIPAVLYAVAHKDPPPLAERAPDLPPGLAALVMRALSKDPSARYADGGEMLAALSEAWEGEAAPATDTGPIEVADASPARPLGPSLTAQPGMPPEMRAALEEIDDYLADRVPPLMVADSVARFAEMPVEGAAAEIATWAERQKLSAPELPMVDILFHALRKLGVIGEFQLVEKGKLIGFLRAVGEVLAAACPPGEDRERLRRALDRVGEAEMMDGGPLAKGREETSLPAPAPPVTPGLRRLVLLEQRLRREVPLRGPASEIARRRIASQAITTAATEARSEKELEGHFRRLRAAGVTGGAEQVFRNLGQELGDWALPRKALADTADIGPASELQAMKKIVSLPEDPTEVARRYRHLVSAATAQFNEGNLGRAVQMFDVAARISAEKKIDPGLLAPVLKSGHEALDPTRLRQYMDKPDRHEQLTVAMSFFANGLGPEPLLDQLETEERRDRRRLLLDLLVVHGENARALASARLVASIEKPATDFARRNWIYLLRQVPRAAGDVAQAEVDAVARLAGPGSPSFLVKEALLYLGQLRHERAATAIVSLLGAWEARLERAGADPAAREDGVAALDRIAAALARQGGPQAWQALLDHGLSWRPEFGNAAQRLAELGAHDLSGAPQVVETLVGEIRASLPRGVLGRLVGRKDQDLPAFVGALAATRTPQVRALLEEVRKRYRGEEAGKAAARALETPPPAPPGVPGQSGELDPYGLPALLQRLGQGKATGTLKLLPEEGAGAPAAIGLSQGRPVSARWAHREGASAVYQLFERSFGGRWVFEPGAPPAHKDDLPELAVLLREGLLRARELQRTSAVVPDDLCLEATGQAPGTVVDEQEYDLIVALWDKACGRSSVRQIEAELAADAFRIYRPLAQWLEEGALRIVTPEPSAPPGPVEEPSSTPSE